METQPTPNKISKINKTKMEAAIKVKDKQVKNESIIKK